MQNFFIIFDNDSKPDKDWILDTTCIFHVYPNRDSLSTYGEVLKGVVMRNNVPYKLVGIGKIRLKILDG